MLQYAVLAGAAINLFGSAAYVRDTFRGTTKPNRVSWLLWGIIPSIAAVAAFSEGATWAIVPVAMSGITPLIIFTASFVNPNAYWKVSGLDYMCGALAMLAIVLWLITDEPLLAVFFAIAADLLAGIPILYKSWKFPETETGFTFVCGFISSLTVFFALKTDNLSEYAFPVYLMCICAVLVVLIYRKRVFAILKR